MIRLPHAHAIKPMKPAKMRKSFAVHLDLPKPKPMPMRTASTRSTASKPVKPLKRAPIGGYRR